MENVQNHVPKITVGLKAPITVRDLHSEVRRDWIQLIGRKLAHITTVKTGLGECPRDIIQDNLSVAPNNLYFQ